MKPELEKIPLGLEQSILAFDFVGKNFEAPWHFHPQHELTLIRESIGTKYVGDYVGPYEPGELVLVRSNVPHCWKNQVDQKAISHSTVIQWNRGIYASVPELEGVFEMLKTASRGILFDAKDCLDLLPLIIRFPNMEKEQLYVQLLAVLVQLAKCSYITLSEARFIDDLPQEFGSRMAQIHDFVEAQYHRKIYLRELAELVNMSEQSFSRFFSKMMGRPFFTFLNEYRINVAGRMLIDTDWSVAQIGYACGYESLPFFHKQFNKFKQISPSRFRKKYAVKVGRN